MVEKDVEEHVEDGHELMVTKITDLFETITTLQVSSRPDSLIETPTVVDFARQNSKIFPRHDFVSTVTSVTRDVLLWYCALVDPFTRSIYRCLRAVVGVPTIIRPHIDLPSPEHLSSPLLL